MIVHPLILAAGLAAFVALIALAARQALREARRDLEHERLLQAVEEHVGVPPAPISMARDRRANDRCRRNGIGRPR